MDRPRFQRSHLEPRTVPLTSRMETVLPASTLTPEELLIAAEESLCMNEQPTSRTELGHEQLQPMTALAIEWWLLGLSQEEIGTWLGVRKAAVCRRIHKGLERLRRQG